MRATQRTIAAMAESITTATNHAGAIDRRRCCRFVRGWRCGSRVAVKSAAVKIGGLFRAAIKHAVALNGSMTSDVAAATRVRCVGGFLCLVRSVVSGVSVGRVFVVFALLLLLFTKSGLLLGALATTTTAASLAPTKVDDDGKRDDGGDGGDHKQSRQPRGGVA